MAQYSDADWKPTTISRVGEAEWTSTGVTRVHTDAGWAFCKPIGNRQGEQVLACEWVCLHLARWLGLSTFRAAIIDLSEDATFDLPEHGGHQYRAQAGPCFLTKSTPGRTWNREAADLQKLVNRNDITTLVVFDTWVRNRDRYYPDPEVKKPNYGNVFMAEIEGAPQRFRLIAMDHTHCFDGGHLHRRLANIDCVKDERIYGLFPDFKPLWNPSVMSRACERLKSLSMDWITTIIDQVPREWQVDIDTRRAWRELIATRAVFVADDLPGRIARLLAEDERG